MPRSGAIIPVLIALAAAAGAGCAPAVNPGAVADAQTAARVRTALVNDPALGLRPIDVRVAGGIVHLVGRVESEAERTRAVALVRSVRGVARVDAALRIGPSPRPDAPDAPVSRLPDAAVPTALDESTDERSVLAVGASFGTARHHQAGGATGYSIAPLVRFGRGTGLGVRVSLSLVSSDFTTPGAGGPLGRLRMLPLMAGLGYTIGRGSVRVSPSLVGGLAFNHLSDRDRSPGPVWALDVTNSFVWRPGVSMWIDLNSRIAVNAFAGHLVTRPRISLLENGAIRRRTLRADTTLLRAGVAYKLF